MRKLCGNAVAVAVAVAAAALPLVAGGACVALSFWLLICQPGRINPPAKKKKKKKQPQQQQPQPPTTREDRISQLPDDVISLIISRLTTRSAVRTSVLSRRWRRICPYINIVRFCCADVYDGSTCNPGKNWSQIQKKFVERVDTFLQHHSDSKIKCFELVCCFRGCILDKFKEWMNSVGTSGVEQLTLGFCCLQNVHRCCCPPVFSTDFLPDQASSLRYLRLRAGSFLTPTKNALKVLELNCVTLTSEAVQCLLSNCSSLQLLNLRFCSLPTKLLIHGPHLQLKSLTTYRCKNVEEIDLSAINLINLEIFNLRILNLSFSRVPLLQTLAISFYESQVAPYVFGKIAQDVPHLESMIFRTYASYFEGFKLDHVISKLINLRQLVLILEYYNKLDLLELAVFLDSCPLLQKFQLSMVLTPTFNLKRIFNLKRTRERMVRHDTQLKEVEFNGFSGTNCEYNFVLHILKHFASLERLVLSPDPVSYNVCLGRYMASTNPGNSERRRRIIRKRLQGQSISKNVEIIIF